MSESQSKENKTFSNIQDVFSLHHDQSHPDKIDAAIRANVRVSGTNMWVLIFAIAVASIGLNVNSTAVIIGAMLISPLMGPIVGVGYGAAVSDMGLIKMSLRNIVVFVIISLFTATLYFLITPLQEAQSELLARTQPTLWDVLIAFFGGSAGIIAITRKEAGNAVPGVAIATALMPPLCTAGYGLAHGNWQYFFGAFYLFAINCVFIAFSTLLFAKLLKLPRRGLVTDSKRWLHRLIITSVISAVMIPSIYLAIGMVRKELFDTTVTAAVRELRQKEGFVVLRNITDYKKQSIGLVVSGSGNAERLSSLLSEKLMQSGIISPQVKVLYAGGDTDLSAIQQAVLSETGNSLQNQLQQQQAYIDSLLAQNQHAEGIQDSEIIKEIYAQFPTAEKIFIGRGLKWETKPDTWSASEVASGVLAASDTSADINTKKVTLIWIHLPEKLSETEQQRLQAYLTQRLKNEKVKLLIHVPYPS